MKISDNALLINLAILYGFFVAGCYLFGLYGYFDINVFQFLSFSNVIVVALWALLPYVILQALMFYFVTESTKPIIDAKIDKLRQADGKEIRRQGARWGKIGLVFNVVSIVVLLFFGYFCGRVTPLAVVLILFVLLVYDFKSPYEYLIFFLILVCPAIGFDVGRQSAKNIYNNKIYQSLTIKNPNQNIVLKFIGHAGSQYFFITQNNDEINIMPDTSQIMLRQIKNDAPVS